MDEVYIMLRSNESRVIIAALETYQSMWAVAVSEARKTGDPTDEQFAQRRYDETGKLLTMFKQEQDKEPHSFSYFTL